MKEYRCNIFRPDQPGIAWLVASGNGAGVKRELDMRYFVEFLTELAPGNYHCSYHGKSVATIDGRLSPKNAHALAKKEAAKRGFDDYWLTKANKFPDNWSHHAVQMGCAFPLI